MSALIAEYASADALVAALGALRRDGWSEVEATSPYPLTAAERALGPRRSRLPWWCVGVGLAGAATAYALQWWCLAVAYPYDVAGFEPHTAVAFVPIAFESGVLSAAFTAFFGVVLGNGLPRLWHPLFEAEGFARATRDRFFLCARCGGGDPARLRASLAATAPLAVSEVAA